MWHKNRFIYHPKKIHVNCLICNCDMYLPKSKVKDYKTCSTECRKIQSENQKQLKTKQCIVCNKDFIPRNTQIKNGQGKYCSQKCFLPFMIKAAHTKEANKKRVKSFKDAINSGKYVVATGENHPKWKGGQKATIQRRIKSGKSKETIKAYRNKNPDKVREWSQTRHKRKTGRLPRGTINNLMLSQNNLCNICHVDISNKYHMDHIYPLAKGGKHEASNIQLLCPSCNVRKSAKDPIQFLKEINNG